MFGDEIRRRRLDKGMTQTVLAVRAGVGEATIRRTETGRHIPSVPVLAAIADALGCRLSLVEAHGAPSDHGLTPGVTPGNVQNGSTSGRPDGQVARNDTGPEDARQRHTSGPGHEELTSVDQEEAAAAGPHPAGLAAA